MTAPQAGANTGSPQVPRRVTLATGVVGGAVGALLGGGTGVVTVPILDRLTTLRRGAIHGTANLVNVAVAVVGAAVYELRGGHLDATAGAGLMVGGVLGAFFGARVAARAGDQALRAAFAVVLAVVAAELCLGAAGVGPSGGSPLLGAGPRHDVTVVVLLTVVIGVVVGAWSAAMGLGGGSLTVPVLILIFGVGPHTAEGTSLLVMLPNSIVASVQHLRQHTASPRLGAALACGAAPGALLGASAGLVLGDAVLGWVFGLFVLLIAAQQLARIRADRS
ncbi:sulfite exporter TauE/SafE family protein [Actinoallomurus acaciae]|uniref:Probable membrane transporter protein n=1 Tax=Actinoallomurus acaciae TaxID=502577 RepID=A0ABV5YCQ0_9ACTN